MKRVEHVKLDPSFVPKLAKKTRLRFDRHEQKHMLLYPERGLSLNDSAAEITKHCDGTRSVAEIVDVLCRVHGDANRIAIEADVLAFVTELRDKGLLELA